MIFIIEVSDEACGMVRYVTEEIEADSRDDAVDKWRERTKDCGPGYYMTSCKEKVTNANKCV